MVIKQLDIRGENYHCFKDLVNLKYLDPSLIKLDKRKSTNFDIYYVKYADKHLLCLFIKALDRYFSEDKHDGWSSKYMHIVENDNNDKVLINYAKIWKVIKDKIDNAEGEYEDSFMKVVINSDDDLPVGKVINFHMLVLTIAHIYKKGNKYCPQIFLANRFFDDM